MKNYNQQELCHKLIERGITPGYRLGGHKSGKTERGFMYFTVLDGNNCGSVAIPTKTPMTTDELLDFVIGECMQSLYDAKQLADKQRNKTND